MPGLLLPLAVAVALIAGACGGADGTAPPTASIAAPSTAESSVTTAGSASPSADSTSGTPASAAPTETPTEAPTPSVDATTSAAPEPAADCTGTDENRTFYGSVATAVDWTVYCPVLPSGWFVEQGQYRLASGGRLAITYRGPGGKRFTLDEGAWCKEASGCLPSGAVVGDASFGDLDGSLIATDAGSFAISADPGATVSWLLVGEGLDQATVRTFGAALIAVGG